MEAQIENFWRSSIEPRLWTVMKPKVKLLEREEISSELLFESIFSNISEEQRA